jgi:hypothetical protein
VAVDKPDIRAAVGAAAGRNLRQRVRARTSSDRPVSAGLQVRTGGPGLSKHKDRPYREGRSPYWIKVKNRSHPAIERVKEPFA